jgi:hypothetical protein
MALSPNYGWSEPDNSSLVKNGAADIRTLGDAIDTSVWNVGYGQAGKNKIINGDFRINQRNFTSNTANDAFNFDRWVQGNSGGTVTVTPQTFTAGAAPVAGYEGVNFVREVVASQSASSDYAFLNQRIEDVRVFAGQTVTISFWAKAASGTPKIAGELAQIFGSGGSGTVTTYAGQATLSTSWARYSLTVANPSISGKTIGTGSNLSLILWLSAGASLNSRTGSIGVQNNTFDIWGVQVEYGSKLTPFQLAGGGDPQSELALCQRYYWRSTSSTAYAYLGNGQAISATSASILVYNPVPMRTAALTIDFSNLGITDAISIQTAITSVINSQANNLTNALSTFGSSGLTQYRPYFLSNQNNANGYIGYGAEL